MTNFAFTVEPAESSCRLDIFLKDHLQIHSRSQIQYWITNGNVLCNGKKIKAAYKVETGDVISGQVVEPTSFLEPENIPLDILYEDDFLIVINKPAGMVVHPAVGHKTSTLVHALAWHLRAGSAFKRGGAFAQESLRPGIVHRLDQDTSGVLVAAKTTLVLEQLSKQVRARQVEKVYHTLVCGVPKENKGEIVGSIASGQGYVKMQITPAGKESQTFFSVLKRFKEHAYLEVYPKTGRTHQIRIHLAQIGYPVLGDRLYGAASPLCQRQMLHALRLTLQHPKTKKKMVFTAPLPVDFKTTLKQLA